MIFSYGVWLLAALLCCPVRADVVAVLPCAAFINGDVLLTETSGVSAELGVLRRAFENLDFGISWGGQGASLLGERMARGDYQINRHAWPQVPRVTTRFQVALRGVPAGAPGHPVHQALAFRVHSFPSHPDLQYLLSTFVTADASDDELLLIYAALKAMPYAQGLEVSVLVDKDQGAPPAAHPDRFTQVMSALKDKRAVHEIAWAMAPPAVQSLLQNPKINQYVGVGIEPLRFDRVERRWDRINRFELRYVFLPDPER